MSFLDELAELPGAPEGAREVLAVLKEHRAPFEAAGRDLAAGVLERLSVGDEDGARLLWLSREATFAERRAAAQAADDELAEDTARREAEWEQIKAALLAAGTKALQVAFALLTAAA